MSRRAIVLWVLGALLVASMLTGLAVGPSSTRWLRVVEVIGGELGLTEAASRTQRAVVFNIRMPRVLLGALVGSVLAVSGAALQGMFRNPLADPGLIGITSGAGLAAALTIVLSGWLVPGADRLEFLLPLTAFLGALVTTLLVRGIANGPAGTQVGTLLLAGVGIGALSGSVIGLLVYVSDDEQLRDLQFWMMGSLGAASWRSLAVAGPLMVGALIALPFQARALNCTTLGEREAGYLGVDVEALKTRLIWLTAVGVGAAVACAGSIGFVGLVVPHLLRLMFGPDHRLLLPASALLGGLAIVLADLAARLIIWPAELPIGILTSAAGSPFFILLLVYHRAGIRGQ